MNEKNLEKIVSWAKRRGFVMPGSEIYGGLSGIYDFGPYGVALKNNIKKLWWKQFVEDRDDVVGIESSILMNRKVWQASGHEADFVDELVECKKCHQRFKADDIPEGKCPSGGEHELTEPKKFNPMFYTFIGVSADESSKTYLRPETAQGMFTDFKQVMEVSRKKVPFGIAQMGKSFRNEINTKDFIFRVREFEIAVTCNLLEKERAIVGAAHFGHAPHKDSYRDDEFNTGNSFGTESPEFLPAPTQFSKDMIEYTEVGKYEPTTIKR